MIFDAIRQAVITEKRFLANVRAPDASYVSASTDPVAIADLGKVQPRNKPPYLFKSGSLMEAVLRVELSRDVEEQIYHQADLEVRNFLSSQMRTGVEGPWVVQGVSWYRVDNLPAPGWRVINPFRDVRL